MNITSYQLYLWSTPLDIIESYEIYLNQLPTSSSSLSKTRFYNCTLPQFGSFCQYSFVNHYKSNHHLSLNDIIYDYYLNITFTSDDRTCYVHLECNLGSSLLCLDWINICDGYVQCIDGNDEEHCWQLEINQCNENEYRCRDGQCIPLIYLDDGIYGAECLDESDIYGDYGQTPLIQYRESLLYEPTIRREDITCLDNKFIFTMGNFPCKMYRLTVMWHFMFSIKPSTMSDICWNTLKCYINLDLSFGLNCNDICLNGMCPNEIEKHCPEMFFLPSVPILYGHIYLAITKTTVLEKVKYDPEYVCYNSELCRGVNPNAYVIQFENKSCRHIKDFPSLNIEAEKVGFLTFNNYIEPMIKLFSNCNTVRRKNLTFCNHSMMYQCLNSLKCISNIRLLDSIADCDYHDDENADVQISFGKICSNETSSMHFQCPTTNRCISRKLLRDRLCHCQSNLGNKAIFCDDEHLSSKHIRELISFPTICNGFVDLNPILIDGLNHTDETECNEWLCNNTYTRCNGYFDCFNIIDEIGCYPSLSLEYNCSLDDYFCISPMTNQLTCLSLEKINNGRIDCLGGIDESQKIRTNTTHYTIGFNCANDNSSSSVHLEFRTYLCDDFKHCKTGADEQFCQLSSTPSLFYSLTCDESNSLIHSEKDKFYCNLFKITPSLDITHFSLGQSKPMKIYERKRNVDFLALYYVLTYQPRRCNRGLPLKLLTNLNKSNEICFCPPSYYGSHCQYQNQRISLTLKLQTYPDSWQTSFILIISLMENTTERMIHSSEQITFLSMKNCQTKYNIYLLYSIRPKNQSKIYLIHIDIYEKLSLTYRGSLVIDIPFLFLPIQRLAIVLTIPSNENNFQSCSDNKCIHGQCIRYFNDLKERTFCQCYSGWSGQYCTIKYQCQCLLDSLCLGQLANNRSICVCPINKWGSRCYIDDYICYLNNPCLNGGQCIPFNQHISTSKKFECLCPKNFFGERCEIQSNKLILSFDKNLLLPETMFIHFLEVKYNSAPEKGILFKKIPFNRNSIEIYWSLKFHIVFIEFSLKDYYLVLIQDIYNQSQIIRKQIQSSDRCPYLPEISNETFNKFHLIRRIKSYHYFCRKYSPNLLCFYDQNFFCLCQDFSHQRQANCFEFNSTLKYDCAGQSQCENHGQCLQDSSTCPQISICICPTCFYGTYCQFNSAKHSLFLDAIIGYSIRPHVHLFNQPLIIKFSFILTILMTFIGFLNGILSLITFRNKILLKNACGIYLYSSSISTLFTITIFFLKFFILLFVQINSNTNRIFLLIQCRIIDYLLRISLHMDQWLNACISFQRAITTIKGVRFNEKKSRKLSKFIIILLVLLTILTNIIDPLHRRLINENNNDEQRLWCIVTYSSNIQRFNEAMDICHFSIPFLINLFSAFIIIIKTARSRSSFHTNQTYKQILMKQFQQHKHLLITSALLIFLTLPRLIITFTTGCMKTMTHTWLFLIGYFISFMPPILTFIIFVIPSKGYKKEFRTTIARYQQTIRKRFPSF